ncbi:MAG: purine-nucleoside phosphorylase [Elusimicrobiota bacterium]
MISEKVDEAKKFLSEKIPFKMEAALILGSGLGEIANAVEKPVRIPYPQIPNFCKSTVEGHKGELVAGNLFGKSVFVMQGRFHYYEGYTLQEVTFPVRLIATSGIKTLILTSAVGGINIKYNAEDLVVISDHINLIGDNPLRGKHEAAFGERFPDMAKIYDKEYIKIIIEIAKKNKIPARKGVYLGLSGPSYETPAEIKAYRKLGADVIGMSVVPEAIVASQSGLRIACISYVSNMAAGMNGLTLSHIDVISVGPKVAPKLKIILKEFLKRI